MLAAPVVQTEVPQRSHFEGVPSASLRVKRGCRLFHAGDDFSTIYSVRFRSFKLLTGDREGRQQVTGFPMPGDVLGLDGISTGRHAVTAVALEDSEVVFVPFATVERAARDDQKLQHHLYELMSQQIVQDQSVMMTLGTLYAAERLAAFLLTLSRKYQRLGYAAGEFNIRMTRADIGSYLGLKIETISRTLTQFEAAGLIEVHDKHIRLVDLDGLEATWRGDGAQATAIERARMVTADARNTRQRSATSRAMSQSLRSLRAAV